jgi:chitin elicitor receptor kinase 1
MLPEREPLSWSTRLQIALDSARGLEYIHEHTVPVYIHRDIKSENILLDKSFCAKVEVVLQIFYFFTVFLTGIMM